MISAAIVGDASVVANLGLRGERVKDEARKAVQSMALKTLVLVKQKLSDDVLRVRTGRLRRSITQKVAEDASSITGTVGTNVEYAARHELGFNGEERVQEHLRTIKTAFGKSIKGGAVTFTVAAHTRTVNYPARSFLATALAELEPGFREQVAAGTLKASSL